MFGGWGASSYTNYDDPLARERDAPPKPLPVQFPEYVPRFSPTPLTAEKHGELKKLLMHIKNPADIAAKHIEAFNIKYRSDVPLSGLIPDLPDGLIEESSLSAILKDDFAAGNDPCFRKVCRLPPEKGQTLPRLSQAFLFYKNLEDMSRYWDNSKDRYFEKDRSTQTQTEAKRHKSVQRETAAPSTDANGDTPMPDLPAPTSPTKRLYTGRRTSNASAMPPQMREATLEGFLRSATPKFNAVCKAPPMQYTRLQVGEVLIPVRQTFVVGRVPSDRAEVRRGKTVGPLIAGSARGEFEFRKDAEERGRGQAECADLMRELGGLLLLAQQRNREGRTETKPGSASEERNWWARKERWGGGKGGHMPHEEIEANGAFPKSVEKYVVIKDALPNGHTAAKRSGDLSRDIAEAALLKAPERVSSLVPSLKKTPDAADAVEPLKSTSTRVERPAMSSRRMKAMYEGWKALKPPSGLWDPNLAYTAIGRVDGVDGDWDDVFVISCVNTHVSILKMSVSRGYMDWLESGRLSEVRRERKLGASGITLARKEEKETNDWEGKNREREVAYVERSRWWDLFAPEERCEALRALWTVLSWVCREVGGGKALGEV